MFAKFTATHRDPHNVMKTTFSSVRCMMCKRDMFARIFWLSILFPPVPTVYFELTIMSQLQ